MDNGVHAFSKGIGLKGVTKVRLRSLLLKQLYNGIFPVVSFVNNVTTIDWFGRREIIRRGNFRKISKTPFTKIGTSKIFLQATTTSIIIYDISIKIIWISDWINCLFTASTSSKTPIKTTDLMETSTSSLPKCQRSQWSLWINHHHPEESDDEEEKLNPDEKQIFCNGGIISNVECREVDTQIAANESISVATCSKDDGLKCIAAENLFGCSDFEVRFYCQCQRKYLDFLHNLQRRYTFFFLIHL